jgi:hypothetical protein
MKNIFLFLSIFVSVPMFGQLRLPYDSIAQTAHPGYFLCWSFDGDSVRYRTTQKFFTFDKQIKMKGDSLETTKGMRVYVLTNASTWKIDSIRYAWKSHDHSGVYQPVGSYMSFTDTLNIISTKKNLIDSVHSLNLRTALAQNIKPSDTARWALGGGGGTSLTKYQMKDSLQALTGSNRLDANYLKNKNYTARTLSGNNLDNDANISYDDQTISAARSMTFTYTNAEKGNGGMVAFIADGVTGHDVTFSNGTLVGGQYDNTANKRNVLQYTYMDNSPDEVGYAWVIGKENTNTWSDDSSHYASKSLVNKLVHDTANNLLRKSSVTALLADSVWAVVDGQAQRTATTTISYGYAIPAYASGTVYTLTTSMAKVDFGTTDPMLTLNVAGTYKLTAIVTVQATAATIGTNRTYSFKLRETQNTSTDIANSTTPVMYTGLMTTATQNLSVVTLPAVYYTTTSTTDVIQIWGALSGAVDAGSIQVIGACIIAEQIY